MTWRLRPNDLIDAEVRRLVHVGAPGPAGIPGTHGGSGVTGPVGAIGAAGPVGNNGLVGGAGLAGSQGLPGVDGVEGGTGVTGPAGAGGTVGATGAAGAAGGVGAGGLVGSVGPAGSAGAAGSAGSAGAAGVAGNTGASPTGAAGPAGSAGVAGAAGPGGAVGATGASAAAGPTPLLLTPLNGATFGGREIDADTVTIFAEIPAGAPAITKVDFYAGATLIGTANAVPWQYQWATTQGSYNIKARVTYADATIGTSAISAITVNPPASVVVPTNCPQVKFWGSASDASTTVVNGLVTSYGLFDGTVVTSKMTQANTAKQMKIGRLRGKAVFFVGGVGTLENYAATLSGAQGFPETFQIGYRGISTQNVGVCMGTGGTERIGIHQVTTGHWPRKDRCITSAAVDDALAQPTAQCTRAVFNNTNSQIWRNGVAIHNPASLGTSGLATSISAPGHSGGASEPGAMLDVVYAQGTVPSTDATNLDNYQIAKYDLNGPVKRILYIGDSQGIVFGLTNGGWRALVQDYLSKGKVAGAWIEEIGFKPEGGTRFFIGDVHDCVSGKGVNYHSNTTPGAGGISTLLGAGLDWQPDIVLLEIGVNNAASSAGETYVAGTGAGSTRAVAQTLITQILTGMPAPGQLIVADLFPDETPATNANIATLNATWFSDADATAAGLGRTIVHANWNAALNGPNYDSSLFQPDNHMNDLGCAATFKEFIRAIAKAAYKHTNGIA